MSAQIRIFPTFITFQIVDENGNLINRNIVRGETMLEEIMREILPYRPRTINVEYQGV